jgi:hypothetical protein
VVKFEGVLINPFLLAVELDDGIELYIIKEPRALRVPLTFTDELKQLLGVVVSALVKRYRKEIKAIREQQEAEERKEERERLEQVIASLKSKIQILESVLELVERSGVG